MVQALLELNDKVRGKDRVKMDDASIEANLARIRDHAADYLEQDDVNPEAAERLRQYRCGEGKKPRGGGAALLPEAANARTLRKWLALVGAGGKWALVDPCAKRGNTNSYFSADEDALLMKTVQEYYLNLNRPSVAETVMEVRKIFIRENEVRGAKGLSAMRIPAARPFASSSRASINSWSLSPATASRRRWSG